MKKEILQNIQELILPKNATMTDITGIAMAEAAWIFGSTRIVQSWANHEDARIFIPLVLGLPMARFIRDLARTNRPQQD